MLVPPHKAAVFLVNPNARGEAPKRRKGNPKVGPKIQRVPQPLPLGLLRPFENPQPSVYKRPGNSPPARSPNQGIMEGPDLLRPYNRLPPGIIGPRTAKGVPKRVKPPRTPREPKGTPGGPGNPRRGAKFRVPNKEEDLKGPENPGLPEPRKPPGGTLAPLAKRFKKAAYLPQAKPKAALHFAPPLILPRPIGQPKFSPQVTRRRVYPVPFAHRPWFPKRPRGLGEYKGLRELTPQEYPAPTKEPCKHPPNQGNKGKARQSAPAGACLQATEQAWNIYHQLWV